ncbi:general stress protein CsbD [Methylobacterium sp. Leaf111]|uniref:CsbD family protein n=1 Tax=unclassified Methylobacterium TaxID=2615210 RepID=UPI0006F6B0B0|nr:MULTISPECIES: CsbD family protein [unclassified Methylobacterium]KQO71888.1 general stress protein CsbD [Methylobacterium sp. Leaf89]KQP75774.1 general stress protein CsbD [Methylobacterium sp. Leaf111]KQU17335.1 general stress protein CsbD [Methylobacterium sp. Leaf94]
MNGDQFRGASRHLKGRAQTVVGGLTGDPARQVRGAVNQVAGGAQYAYGRARDRAEDLVDDGRHLAHEVRDRAGHWIEEGRDRADHLIDEGRAFTRHARKRGSTYGRRAVRYADDNRASALLGLAAVAFAVGWFARPRR